MFRNDFSSNGISVSPTVPSYGDKVRVTYEGLLSKSGACEVYAHVGFGHNWTNQSDFKMTRTQNGFEASIPVSSHEQLNLCFKDTANNWDNNSGQNYTIPINS